MVIRVINGKVVVASDRIRLSNGEVISASNGNSAPTLELNIHVNCLRS